MKVGVLSGGGDAPGINAVIRAVVRKGIRNYDYEMIGIKDGWKGLIDNSFMPLNLKTISGILPRGGTILGTSRTNPFKHEKGPQTVIENVKKKNIDAIVVIGGDDTLGVAKKMGDPGLLCVGVPKTIDNDLGLTDYTFGFNTAVHIACEAIDRLHSTAESHQRVMILEVMGRYTGWIALEAGIAGGADIILIPEKPFDLKEVCQHILHRLEQGKCFSLVVVSEGAKPKGSEHIVYGVGSDEFGNVRLGGVGYYVGKEIEEITGIETRVVVLGHLQRGGSPTAYDRILATRYGIAAIDLVHQNNYGMMVALKGNHIISVHLKDVIGKRKSVDLNLYELAKVFSG
ncbi:6-phosphofructokinase [Candidatus Bathyarchaeota archaeon]|nr:6-phosphofructokinase [Candidatus Bathyarchaeota archaeon]